MLKKSLLTVAATTALSLASSLPFQDIARSLIQERQERSTPATALERQMLREESAPMSRSAASCSFGGTIVDSEGNARANIGSIKVYDKYGYVYCWIGTDELGSFNTSLLPAGTYTFNDGWNALGTLYGNVTKLEDAKWVTLESGHTDLGTIVMDPTEDLSGSSNGENTITFTGTVTDPDGNPVKNRSFTLAVAPVNGRDQTLSATTDSEGNYNVTGEIYKSETGEYYAMLTNFTHVDSSFNAAYPLFFNGEHFRTPAPQTITIAGTAADLNFSLISGGTLSLPLEPRGDERFREIRMIDSAGAVVRESYSPSTDTVTWTGLPEGKYYLILNSTDEQYETTSHFYPQEQSKSEATALFITAGDTTTVPSPLHFPEVTLIAQPTDSITISGTVTDSYGTPVKSATVRLISDAQRDRSSCNENGEYSVTVLAGSPKIELKAYVDNNDIHLQDVTIDTSVTLNSAFTRNIVLPDAGSIGILFKDTTVESSQLLESMYTGTAINSDGVAYSEWRGGDDKQKWGMTIPAVPAGEYAVSHVPFTWEVSEEFLNSPISGPSAVVSRTTVIVKNDSVSEHVPTVTYESGVLNGYYSSETPQDWEEIPMAYCYNSAGTLMGASIVYSEEPDGAPWREFLYYADFEGGKKVAQPVTFPFLPAGDYYVVVATPTTTGYSAHWYGSDSAVTKDSPLGFLYGRDELPRVIPSDAKKISLAKDGIIRDINFNEAGGSSVIEAGIKEAKIQFSLVQNTIRLAVPAGVAGEGSLKLYSLNGRMIARKAITGKEKLVQWNLESLSIAPGTYIAEFKAGAAKQSFKIAVQ